MLKTPFFKIFPLQPNSKIPYSTIHDEDGRGGFYAASGNQGKVALWIKAYPQANWAVRTGECSKIWVLDIDCKNGAKGGESLYSLLKENEIPNTYTVRTPSGGLHYYFNWSDPRVKSMNGVGEHGGIDIKADNGYVLIPPSTLNGVGYTVINDVPIIDAPEFLMKALFGGKRKVSYFAPNDFIFTEENAIDRITELAKHTHKGTRNEVLFYFACNLRDKEIPLSKALKYGKVFISNIPDGGFSDKEMENTIKSAYTKQPFRIKNEAEQKELILTDTPQDQREIASLFAGLFSEKYIYTEGLGWFVYTQGFWQKEKADAYLLADISQMLKDIAKVSPKSKLFKCDMGNFKGILGFLEILMCKEPKIFNANSELLNCANGVINLRTLTLAPHNPIYYFTYKLNVNFDTKSNPTLWLKFLRETVEDNQETDKDGVPFSIIEQLQLALGYSLTDEASEECFFYVYGKTRSGKGTMMNTIYKILGDLAGTVNISTLSKRERGGDTQNFELASLMGKRYIVASETDKDTYFDAAKMKTLAGRDSIKAALKYKPFFEFVFSGKIWVSSNHEINLDPTDDAVWGRVRIFNFPFSKIDNPDPNLKDKLYAERDSIFTWCCIGAYVWYKLRDAGNRIPISKHMKEQMQNRREEIDMIYQFMLSEGIMPSNDPKDGFMTTGELYIKFAQWSEKNYYKHSYGRNAFTTAITNKGFIKTRKVYDGKQTYGFLIAPTNWSGA